MVCQPEELQICNYHLMCKKSCNNIMIKTILIFFFTSVTKSSESIWNETEYKYTQTQASTLKGNFKQLFKALNRI